MIIDIFVEGGINIFKIIKKTVLVIIIMFSSLISSFLYSENINAASQAVQYHPIYSVDIPEKKVSLTFDVNWAEDDHIMEILDILDQNSVKATFFVIGKWINYSEENSAVLKEISSRGHEIGNHSYSHADFSKISNESMQKEIKDTDERIKDITGQREVKLFRFPSGAYNSNSVLQVNDSNHFAIQWSADSVDWKEEGLDYEYKRIMKGVCPGAIFLFHNNAKYTPKNLKKLIPEIKKQGYSFVKVSDLIYQENFYIDSNGKQIRK